MAKRLRAPDILPEDCSSVPSTPIRQLTAASNPAPVDLKPHTGLTCTHRPQN